MKKFTIPCSFGGNKAPFDFYIGKPKPGNHPLQNQSAWLSSERGGNVPQEVMESFSKLLELSVSKGVSFEELCVFALEVANQKNAGQAKPASPPSPAPKASTPAATPSGEAAAGGGTAPPAGGGTAEGGAADANPASAAPADGGASS